ncbi:alginate export family protein [Catenovulum sp. SX2]|uniref:alginate export family protein n=1 Tax=Catenovulum sp. SX2 TaxID=3398614 RepID=UPI003F835A87
MELKKSKLALTLASVLSAGFMSTSAMAADSLATAFKEGTAFGDFRLRYEDAEIGATDGSALTFRTRLGFKTAAVSGFSALVEFEDNRQVLGEDDYNTALAGVDKGKAEISDPEFTELEQAYIAYANGGFSAKLGRQVITLDGHRHVGHVGWRQDRQTFDALNVGFKSGDFNATLAYVYKHNRIFGEVRDVDADTILVNLSYDTGFGKAVAYGYQIAPEATQEVDTYGVSFTGATGGDVKFSYSAEYAVQDNKTLDIDTSYLALELGATFSGFTVKVGQETLGSDDGNGHFITPLATLHKFNGFADVFLGHTFNSPATGMGLVDTYAFVGTKVGGVALKAFYHTFDSDEGSLDYGDEIDFVAATKFGSYTTGLKYATYSAKDGSYADTDRLWVWVETSF